MAPRPVFLDRADAGRALARALGAVASLRDVVVLGLARGGVPVARQVADALGAPLDVIVVRKLGVPGVREVAVGAIAEGSNRVVGDSAGWYIGIPSHVVARIARRERAELERRACLYHAGRPIPDVRGHTVVLVDDGLATGATLRAAAFVLRRRRPARLVVTVPVACRESAIELSDEVHHLIAAATPEPFGTVSDWYEDFSPVSDADVLRLLGRPPEVSLGRSDARHRDSQDERTVTIPGEGGSIAGDLGLPDDLADGGATRGFTEPRGLVVLAHGGGSSRHSYRNRYLAGRLRLEGWATLRLDLLLERERAHDDERGTLRFDVALIARRLLAAIDWAKCEHVPGANRVVLFGASTGAAAALVAAAERPPLIAGVVTRGGRVDLAGDALSRVRAPVLMVVGGADADTLRWNREAMRVLRADARLEVIAGAGHTFEEPGTVGALGEHVARWLDRLSRTAGERMWRHLFPLPARFSELPGATMLERLTNVRRSSFP